MASFILFTCGLSCDASLDVIEQAITGRETPHARPSATFDGTKTYGTFCARGRQGVAGLSLTRDAGGVICPAPGLPPAHLVLAEQRQMHEDLNRLRVRGHDDELGDAAVQSLGRCRRCEDRGWVGAALVRKRPNGASGMDAKAGNPPTPSDRPLPRPSPSLAPFLSCL